ncbi:hypothetical protein [Actinomadura hallensis]|uniref:hypothetical protein n=1 Tax=Actinomadura hallensis TaxID=337895 RepID=UPI00114F8234|nr:hypothetical protein [Actinomadura hallensis]
MNAELQALVDDARFMSGSAALASGAHPEVPAPAARLHVPAPTARLQVPGRGGPAATASGTEGSGNGPIRA